jgi:hypothetical protein
MKPKTLVIIAASLALSGAVGVWSSLRGGLHPATSTGGVGTVGSNGLHPAVYAKYQAALSRLMGYSLTHPPGSRFLNPEWGKQILEEDQSPEARKLVSDAIDCAVQTSTALEYTPKKTKVTLRFGPGNGILAGTGGWLGAPLDPSQWAAVHTCLATRMNFTSNVKVWMEGSDIRATMTADEMKKFQVVEGYWGAQMSGTTATIYYWPPSASGISDTSLGLVEPAFAPGHDPSLLDVDRYCVSVASQCPFQKGTGGCTKAPDGAAPRWTCNGIAAVETRLTCADCCVPTFAAPPGFCAGCPSPCRAE